MPKDPYPQHTKLKEVSDKTQFVHDFLTFCEEKLIFLTNGHGNYARHDELLYEFTGIDRWKLEDEKRAMLDSCRKTQKSGKG